MRRTLAITRLILVLALSIATVVPLSGAGTSLVLKISWAKKYSNRLSIDAKVTVLALNAGKEDDGDSHGGSRVNAAGLPMVAEILNGTAPAQQMAKGKLAAATPAQKDVYGAWRLWFEHPPPSGSTQCQTFSGQPAPICDVAPHGADSNPAHSFEIHPVFEVEGIRIARSSLKLTADNQSVKDTDDAFNVYTGTNKVLNIARSTTALTLSSISITNNYVRMRIRITQPKKPTLRVKDGSIDGGFVLADILSSEHHSDTLKSGARVFYFRDSEPGDALDAAVKNDEFEVLAMPRMDLDEVLRVTEGKQAHSMKVPFEFIVVAFIKKL